MPLPKDLVREALFRYPTLFKSPKAALISLFTAYGSRIAWNAQGQLYSLDSQPVERMNYSDLDASEADNAERAKSPALLSMSISVGLNIAKERLNRQFIETHIDALTGHSLHDHFGLRPSRDDNYISGNIGIEEFPAFTFPDNIAPEWAAVLYHFLSNWTADMAGVYGYPPYVKGSTWQDWIEHWPPNAQTLYAHIIVARKRLHPFAHHGQTYAEYVAKCKNHVI